jgi:hypothetical protein
LAFKLNNFLLAVAMMVLSSAIQKTDKHKAMVMAVSFHFVGYTKSSSSSVALACELRFDVVSAATFFSSATIGSVASAAPVVGGMTLSTTPGFSRIEGSWLCVAVLSESAILALVDGLRLFASVICIKVFQVWMYLGRCGVKCQEGEVKLCDCCEDERYLIEGQEDYKYY